VRAALARLLLAAGVLVLAAPAPAADAAACSGSSGVTVVVDFGSLGGIQVGCAAGRPGSGLAALHSAGFSTTGTQHDGPGFVCRINGAPSSDPCVRTPPASRYWSYWHAEAGKPWAYSSSGAGVSDPMPGTTEGWSFGAGARPGIAPPAAPAPPRPPAPKPTAKPAPKPPPVAAPGAPAPPPGAPGRPSSSGAGTTARPPGAPGSAAPSTSAGATTSPGSTSTAAAAGSGPPGPGSSAAAGAAPATEDPGPPADVATKPASSSRTIGAFSLGGALILGLGTAAFLVARRRRTG
jgi:hypothetical protein